MLLHGDDIMSAISQLAEVQDSDQMVCGVLLFCEGCFQRLGDWMLTNAEEALADCRVSHPGADEAYAQGFLIGMSAGIIAERDRQSRN